MPAAAIKVRDVWKEYVIGGRERGGTTFREVLSGALTTPFRRMLRRGGAAPEERFWALQGVDFTVAPGEIVGIIGRNGAGKSTLLKVLSRITEPTRGSVELRGRVASLLEVGTGFHPELTGRENLFLNGAILGMSRREIQRKFDAIVAFAEVEKFLDTPVKHYSSGMYVRLAFSVAAHLEPEILLVDEVLAVGDFEFQRKCLGRMKEISGSEGRTVLFVSHDIQAINALTQRCLLLDHGRCVAIGETSGVISAYVNPSIGERAVWSAAPADAPRVIRAELATSDANNLHVHGEPLRLLFDVHVPRRWSGCSFSFQICNEQGAPIVHSWSFDRPLGIVREPGIHRLVCEIPRLRLYLGRYYLRFYLSDDQYGAQLQFVDHACPFEVVMGTLRRQFPWRSGDAAYIEDATWIVTPAS